MARLPVSRDYFDNPITDNDFIQIALDVYGASVRDNTRGQLVWLGRAYYESGEE